MRGSLPAVAAQSRKSGFPSRLSRVIGPQGTVKLRLTSKAVVDVDSGVSWGGARGGTSIERSIEGRS